MAEIDARIKARKDAIAGILDPDGLLKLADTARSKADARVSDHGRERAEFSDPRWQDWQRAQDAPLIEREGEFEIQKALFERYPDPNQRASKLCDLKRLEAQRTHIQKKFA